MLSAYGINNLALDGTGQTIAIVDAYDDPDIFQAVDAFDNQFGLTGSGPTLFDQYGPASSFLTVLNQNGQSTSLPGTDPNGPGTDNWEVEESLDVEWAHAVAPGAQIVLVEANSQSLSDLMTAVATAASQPGVSVVSMSWGFAEGQAVFAADEASYDSTFNVPGVTFVAGTGDYGAADPEYPAFSPNVVAVGGTSLNLNADNSYNSETGWGYNSDSAGEFIGSGGGISMYEPEPAYQEGVQSTGSRTTPDVSLVADPATGAWIADPYNLGADNPFEVVGGTSLSAPAWAGLVALVNEGRAAAGLATLDSSSPTETQQALYSLPQSDYNVITSGSNGYTANAGYNLVTGLGTPVANLLVARPGRLPGARHDLFRPDGRRVAGCHARQHRVEWRRYRQCVQRIQRHHRVEQRARIWPGARCGQHHRHADLRDAGAGRGGEPLGGHAGDNVGATSGWRPAPFRRWVRPGARLGDEFQPPGQTSQSPAAVTITPVSTSRAYARGRMVHGTSGRELSGQLRESGRIVGNGSGSTRRTHPVTTSARPRVRRGPGRAGRRLGPVAVRSRGTEPSRFRFCRRTGSTRDPVIGDPLPQRDLSLPPADYAAGLAVLGLAAGFWARGTGVMMPESGGPDACFPAGNRRDGDCGISTVESPHATDLHNTRIETAPSPPYALRGGCRWRKLLPRRNADCIG